MLKQLNHQKFFHVLPQITNFLIRSVDGSNNVDLGIYWNPLGAVITEYGICASTSSMTPDISDRILQNTGPFFYSTTANPYYAIPGFTLGTTYYVRAYIKNVVGIVWSDVIIVNIGSSTTVPSVTTESVTNILVTKAQSGGNVMTDGGATVTERGICYNTTGSPTTSDTKVVTGSGLGSFISQLTGLNPNTTYYIRAYAINSVGTGYGASVSFTTSIASVPSLVFYDVQDIEETSFTAFGRVVDNGGSAITEKGWCWNLTGNPNIIYDTKITDGSGDADFDTVISSLPSGVDVFIRCYGINSTGTGYSYTAFIAMPGSSFYPVKYGLLYNWYVLTDSRNICPSGWRPLTTSETYSIYISSSGSVNGGYKLKSDNDIYWTSGGGSNIYNFNAKAAGIRRVGGGFVGVGVQSAILTTNEYLSIYALAMTIEDNTDTIPSYTAIYYKTDGCSLRWVKEDGIDPGFVVGNDGKKYMTTVIAGLVVTAENVAETKFRDGSLVPLITNQTDWNSLVSPGCCYVNDDSNTM